MLKVQNTPQQLITVGMYYQKRRDNVVYFYIYVMLSEIIFFFFLGALTICIRSRQHGGSSEF